MKEKTLKADERVAVWVSPDTRKRLLLRKIKGNYNNIDSLIRELLLTVNLRVIQ